MIEKIKALARDIHPTIIKNRRHLHAHPELSFCEFNTSRFIKSKLDELGIPWKEIANTGIVATISGKSGPGKVIALRADIDALPITEVSEVEYISSSPGVMHACGHDGHSASLLGVAEILTRLKNEFAGTVKLLFQPGEEKVPGGAISMIKEGALENPKVDAVIGQHVIPFMGSGKLGIRPGKLMASTDELFITVKGKGGHAASPHNNIDPVVIAAQIILTLQQVVSRHADPQNPTVFSIGKVIANGAVNVIPDEVYMEGTFRAMNEVWRNEAHDKMQKMAVGIAESLGGSCEFKILRGYPVLINNENLALEIRELAKEYVGEENVIEPDLWMAAEDFAYYGQVSDACFYFLGIGSKEKRTTSPLHSATFNIDEDALMLGAGFMAYVALKKLQG